MNIPYDNPHYQRLVASLQTEANSSSLDQHIQLRATIQGVSISDYKAMQSQFPFLTWDELSAVISNIIAWYKAAEAIRKISGKL